jgi:hypothetical protein
MQRFLISGLLWIKLRSRRLSNSSIIFIKKYYF